MKQAARALCEDGFAVLPLFCADLAALESRCKQVIFQECVELLPADPQQRKFKRAHDSNGKLSGSLFHHRDTRAWRTAAFAATCELMREVVLQDSGESPPALRLPDSIRARPAVACCPDCLLARPPHVKVNSAGSYHYDVVADPSGASSSDWILGGWCNLNSQASQSFLCVRGSHLEHNALRAPAKSRGGFCRLDAAGQLEASERSEVVAVPPGHLLVFFERLTHGIANAPPGKDWMLRLFTGLRLSHEGNSELYPDLRTQLRKKGAVCIKGGVPLEGVARPGCFRHTTTAIKSANAYIDSHVVPGLREPMRVRLSAREGSEDAAWPAMSDSAYPAYSRELFPDWGEEEMALFDLHPLALSEEGDRKRLRCR